MCRPPRQVNLLLLPLSSVTSGKVLFEIVLNFFGLDGHGYTGFIPELELDCDRLLVSSFRLISLSHRMSVPSTSSAGCMRDLLLRIHVNLFLDHKNIGRERFWREQYLNKSENCRKWVLANRHS